MDRWIRVFSFLFHRVPPRVALCLVLTAVLAHSARAADAGGIDPCGLVTKPEAQAVLGAAVASENSPPARANKSSVRICSIQGVNGRALTVFVGSRTKAAFDHEKSGKTSVAGIGDDAYAIAPGLVAMRKGETAVTLSMNSSDSGGDAGLLDKVKALARAVSGRL